MKNMIIRAVISAAAAILVYLIGYYGIGSVIATDDISIGLIFIGAVLAGGCVWIGSRP